MGASGEAYGEIRERRTCRGKRDHAVRTFLAVGFGENVACSDIEDESREYAQIHEERVRGKDEEQSRERSGNGSQSVCQQEGFRTFLRIFMGKHERDGIHAVGESVRDDRERDRHSHRRIDLESKPYSYAVEKAVADERRSGKRTYVRMVVVRVIPFVVMVDENGLFQKMENEKTRSERDHRVCRVEVRFVCDFKNLRKYFESGDSQ